MTEARPAAHPDTAQVAEAVVGAEEAELSYRAAAQAPAPAQRGRAGSFQSRLALVFTTMAIVPLLIFGALMVATGSVETGGDVRSLLIAATITFVIVIVGGFAAASRLTAPLRELAATVERVGTAAPAGPLPLPGDRAFARLDDGRERLAADIGRRDRELSEILNAAKSATPQEALERFAERAARGAAASFGLIDASIILGPPDEISALERSPGEPPTVRAEVHAGHERLGVFVGRLPAMRRWEPADQTLLDLFAREIGVAIRNAQLLAQVESQYGQLQRLGEAKDDFLRGVTHNLQTPLTNIRAQATQLAQAAVNGEPRWSKDADRRLTIIAEQADRLTRMVQQLLLVSRLDSGPLRPASDVLALGQRVRRAWEAFGDRETQLHVSDHAVGWLAIGDADHLDQVLWALLDNAVKYGSGPIRIEVGVDEPRGRVHLTISDQGQGISVEDGERLFHRFSRGSAGRQSDGSGLGLYVSRELMRGMGGELSLEAPAPGRGATFSLELPGEPATEA